MHLWTNSENLSLADQQSFLPLFSLSRRVIPFNPPFHPWQSRTHRLAVKQDCVHCVTRAHEAVKKKKIHRINKLELLDLDLVGYFWPMLCIRDTIMSIFFRLFYMCSWWRAGMRRVWLQRGLRKTNRGSSIDHQRGGWSRPARLKHLNI